MSKKNPSQGGKVSSKLQKTPVFEIIAVGNMKQKFGGIQDSIQDYLKRLQPYAPTLIVEAPEEPLHVNESPEHIMHAEARWIQKYLTHKQPRAVIALTERGESYTSEAFAQALATWEPRVSPIQKGGISTHGAVAPTLFLIGGSLGLHPEILQQATARLSLAPMTFPHHLARLVLVEQLYRACRILYRHPYHH
ncbi:MAG: 23S rRNA (pseudouridine(1915)-N(3))-methyltransferase RlmH [Vampirovibrionales bacterium]